MNPSLKKTLKITWISLASLLGLILVVLLLAFYLILTPKRITSLVNSYAPDFITCDFNLKKADITIFKTFPDLGLEINDLTLINKMEGAQSDTLANLHSFVVKVDIKKLLNNEIVITPCALENGSVNIFIDKDGKSNFDIFPPSEEVEEESEEPSTAWNFTINGVSLRNLNATYIDRSQAMEVATNNLSIEADGYSTLSDEATKITLSLQKAFFAIDNEETPMKASLHNFALAAKIKESNNNIALADIENLSLQKAEYSSGNDIFSAEDLRCGINYSVDKEKNNLLACNFSSIVNATMDSAVYADNLHIAFSTNSVINDDYTKIALKDTKIQVNQAELCTNMNVEMLSDSTINLFGNIKSNELVIKDLLALIPASFAESLEGITADGLMQFDADIAGCYSDSLMPDVDAHLVLKDANATMSGTLPYPVKAINADVKAKAQKNLELIDLTINNFGATMHNSYVGVRGSVADVLNTMFCSLTVTTNANLNDVKTFLPDDIKATGKVRGNMKIRGSVDDLSNMNFAQARLSGALQTEALDLLCFDTIAVKSDKMSLDFVVPNTAENAFKSLAKIDIKGSACDAEIGTMVTQLRDFRADMSVSDVLDEEAPLQAKVDYRWGDLRFTMDDMNLYSHNGQGSATMDPQQGIDHYNASFLGDSLHYTMEGMLFASKKANLIADVTDDTTKVDIFEQFNPQVSLKLDDAIFTMDGLKDDVVIKTLDVVYDSTGLDFNDSKIIIGSSDFALTGRLAGIPDYYRNNDLLYGKLDFTSDYTDVNALLDLVSGLGTDEATEVATTDVTTTTTATEEEVNVDDPFIVPVGSYITLNANIKHASAFNMEIDNVRGEVTVKDGTLLVQDVGFTSDAAKMLLTAIYRSPRPNHLYVGLDFHLLDIDIAEMIRIIPTIDTIIPMLKSFAGKAEFNIAAEVNLKSDYSPKFSTLLGAVSIKGKDLVILDEETYQTMAKYLFFKAKDHNKIDSLSVEIVAKEKDVDVYPFIVTMDRYSFKLEGRHRLDMTFNYVARALKPNLISHLGVRVKDKDDSFTFKPLFSFHRNKMENKKSKELEKIQEEFRRAVQKAAQDNIDNYYKKFE